MHDVGDGPSVVPLSCLGLDLMLMSVVPWTSALFKQAAVRWVRTLVMGAGGIALLIAILMARRDRPTSYHSQLRSATASYYQGSYLEAYGYFKGNEEAFLQLEEGCELMISVFAQMKRLASLEAIARRCLAEGKAQAIAAEGVAMALSSVGRSQEAIEILLTIEGYSTNHRILSALSQLSIYVGKEDEARKFLLAALEVSDTWSVWLERILQRSEFQSPEFLRQVVWLIARKEAVMPDQEKRLISLLEKSQLDSEAEMIKNRLTSEEKRH